MNTTATQPTDVPSTGKTKSKQQIRSYYLREQVNIFQCKDGRLSRGTPQALFVSKVDQEKQTISFGFSVCYSGSTKSDTPADAFSRSKARAMALGRLEKKPWVIPLPKAANGHEINLAIMNAVLDDEEVKLYVGQLQNAKGLTAFSTESYKIRVYVEKLVSPRLRKLVSAWVSRPRPSKNVPNAGQLIAAIQVLRDARIDTSGIENNVAKVFGGITKFDHKLDN